MKKSVSMAAAVAAMVLWASAASAQGIAGKWAIDMEKTQAANPAMQGGGGGNGGGGNGGGGRQGGGFAGGAMTITLSASEMGITRNSPNGDMTTTYKLDGSEQTISMGRGEAKAKAKMDGGKVVIETTREGRDGGSVTSKAVYSVEGDYLVVETTQPGRDGNMTTSKRYYKKAA